MIHIYNSRFSSCAETSNISCWFFDEHKNVVMLPKHFCSHQKPTVLGKCQHGAHSVRLCCRRKGYSLYLHQKLVVSCIQCGGLWSGGVTINTRALIMFSVTTATRITHDSNLSMFGGDFLPTLGESPPTSGSST